MIVQRTSSDRFERQLVKWFFWQNLEGMNIGTKLIVLDTFITNVLNYASGTKTLGKRNINRLIAFQMKCFGEYFTTKGQKR